MKKYKSKGKLIYYEHLNNSYYGNPRYLATFELENGDFITGKTASDGALAYGFTNYSNKVREIVYHFTAKGNIIFDRQNILESEDF